MPGQPVALARVVWNVPQRFTLENHQAAAGSAAIIRQAQETSRFAGPTFRQIVAPRNTKNSAPCEEAVDDVTSLWKTEENYELIFSAPILFASPFNKLDGVKNSRMQR
jgi:hypothetical protein